MPSPIQPSISDDLSHNYHTTNFNHPQAINVNMADRKIISPRPRSKNILQPSPEKPFNTPLPTQPRQTESNVVISLVSGSAPGTTSSPSSPTFKRVTNHSLAASNPPPTAGNPPPRSVLVNVARCRYCTFPLFTHLPSQTPREAVYLDYYLQLHAEMHNQAGVHQDAAKRKDAAITNLRAEVEQLKTVLLRRELKDANAAFDRLKKERIQERNEERRKLDAAKNTIKQHEKTIQALKDQRKAAKEGHEKQRQNAETAIMQKYDELGVLIRQKIGPGNETTEWDGEDEEEDSDEDSDEETLL